MTHDTARRQLEDSVWAIEIPHSPYADRTRELIVEALHAAGYRKHPEPEITEEMVERAAQALFERAGASAWRAGWDLVPEATRAMYRDDARDALVAALRVPAGEGEQ